MNVRELFPAGLLGDALIEGVLLAMFMVAACAAVVGVEHPRSRVRRAIESRLVRRAIIGVAMGLTAHTLITSALGQRSGAMLNPATSLVMAGLGRLTPGRAGAYIVAQVLGAVAGVALARLLLGRGLAEPPVRFAVTRPGVHGRWVAAAGELVVAFVMLSAVLWLQWLGLGLWVPVVAALLVMLFITVEAPLSGMSLNPARSLGSALHAREFSAIWVYLLVPPLGMALAALLFATVNPNTSACPKLCHPTGQRCQICGADDRPPPRQAAPDHPGRRGVVASPPGQPGRHGSGGAASDAAEPMHTPSPGDSH